MFGRTVDVVENTVVGNVYLAIRPRLEVAFFFVVQFAALNVTLFIDHREAMALQYQNHDFDPVARTPGVGFNPGTGGNIPDGSNRLWEWLKVFGAENTVHNCYGNGGTACQKYWDQSPTGKPEFVKVPQS